MYWSETETSFWRLEARAEPGPDESFTVGLHADMVVSRDINDSSNTID